MYNRLKENNISLEEHLPESYYSTMTEGYNDELKNLRGHVNVIYDYLVNTQLHNADMYKIMQGDPAMLTKNDVLDNKRQIGVMIPMKHFRAKKGETFFQAVIKNTTRPSTSFLSIAKLIYPKKIEEITKLHNELHTPKALEEIRTKFPMIYSYADMDSSDSQEYITEKGYVESLYRTNVITKEKYEDFIKKIEKRKSKEKQAEREGRSLSKEEEKDFLITEQEMLFTSMKTGYFGNARNGYNGKLKTKMFIKASTFPLTYSVSKGIGALSSLRSKLEEIEDSTNHVFAKASYESGVKQGAPAKPLITFDKEGKSKEYTTKQLINSGVDLEISGLGMVQGNPLSKKDLYKIPTPLLRKIFSPSIINHNNFVYEGKKYTGKKLHSFFVKKYDEYLKNEVSLLYKELFIDENTVDEYTSKNTIDKLTEIIKKEGIQRNYPLSELESLKAIELPHGGWGFKTPLFVMDNRSKLQQIIFSVANKRTTDMIVRGNGYMLVTELGYNNDSKVRNKDKGIVYLDNHKGSLREFSITKDEDGKEVFRPAEIILPATMEDVEGKKVHLLHNNGTPNEKYIGKDKFGNYFLREEYFDSKLLDVLGTRVPTSAPMSIQPYRIVALLPNEFRKIVITAPDSYARMGSGNDGDKTSITMFHLFTDENGNIKKLTRENYKDKEISEYIEQKILENEIIDIMQSVASSPDKEVQAMFSVGLGYERLLDIADKFSKETEKHDIVSYDYQNNIYNTAKNTQVLVGPITVNLSLVYNAGSSTKPIRLMKVVKSKEGVITRVPYILKFGNHTIDGRLGKKFALTDPMNIEILFMELQNLALDDGSKGNLGKLGITTNTLTVLNMMMMLGFPYEEIVLKDKTKKSMYLPFLILNQPIIKEFLRIKARSERRFNEYRKYDYQIINELKKELLDLYLSDFPSVEEYKKRNTATMLKRGKEYMTGQKLYNEIGEDYGAEAAMQYAVLDIFSTMKGYADILFNVSEFHQLGVHGGSINPAKNKDSMEKIINIRNLYGAGMNTPGIGIAGIQNLIGDYVYNLNGKDDLKTELEAKGYSVFRDVAIKPTNISSVASFQALKVVNMFTKKFFIDFDITVVKMINRLADAMGYDKKNSYSFTKFSEKVNKGIIQYLFSNSIFNFYDGNVEDKRYELLVDEGIKMSLGTYLKKLLNYFGENQQEIETKKYLNTISLLNDFTYRTIGSRTEIHFDNSKRRDIDETFYYQSMETLLSDRRELPKFNGKDYNTYLLALDLTAYSYIYDNGNPVNQFSRFIADVILDKFTDFTKVVSQWNNESNPNFLSEMINRNEGDSPFMVQFYQNYTHLVRYKAEVQGFSKNAPNYFLNKLGFVQYATDADAGNLDRIISFEYVGNNKEEEKKDDQNGITRFKVLKNKKKLLLFVRVPSQKRYLRIPVGKGEYSYGAYVARTTSGEKGLEGNVTLLNRLYNNKSLTRLKKGVVKNIDITE